MAAVPALQWVARHQWDNALKACLSRSLLPVFLEAASLAKGAIVVGRKTRQVRCTQSERTYVCVVGQQRVTVIVPRHALIQMACIHVGHHLVEVLLPLRHVLGEQPLGQIVRGLQCRSH